MANVDMQIVAMLGDMMSQGPLDPELAESIANTDDDTLFGIASLLSELLDPDDAGSWADMGRLLDTKPEVQDRLLRNKELSAAIIG